MYIVRFCNYNYCRIVTVESVCYMVLLTRYCGIFGPGEVPRFSPCTLTTLLAICVFVCYTGPLLFLFNSLRADPGTNAVYNQGQALAAPCLGRSNVRSASSVRCNPESNRQVRRTIYTFNQMHHKRPCM